MRFSINPIADSMGAEVTGIDLRQTPDQDTIDALNDAFHEFIVLCIRDQHFTPEEYLAAARLFGNPARQTNKSLNSRDFPEIGILSSEDKDIHGTGERVIRGQTWHTDHSFTARPPKATILYSIVTPKSGGETSFCNTRAAYAALPEDMKQRIDGYHAIHSYESSRSPRRMLGQTAEEKAETPDVVHPLARRHPPTGTTALFLSTTRLEKIVELDRAESDALVDKLVAHATRPQFRYDHEWRVGDMVIWDNRCSLHHANANYASDQKRLLHRIILEGEIPV